MFLSLLDPDPLVRYGSGSESGFVPSVADPNPDPPDPRVFGPPGSGSGSISQRYPDPGLDPSIIKQK